MIDQPIRATCGTCGIFLGDTADIPILRLSMQEHYATCTDYLTAGEGLIKERPIHWERPRPDDDAVSEEASRQTESEHPTSV